MAVRFVLVALVACLGLNLDSNPNHDAATRGDAQLREPTTVTWIRERIRRVEQAIADASARPIRTEPLTLAPARRTIGVAATGLAWPNLLADGIGPFGKTNATVMIDRIESAPATAIAAIESVELPIEPALDLDSKFSDAVAQIKYVFEHDLASLVYGTRSSGVTTRIEPELVTQVEQAPEVAPAAEAVNVSAAPAAETAMIEAELEPFDATESLVDALELNARHDGVEDVTAEPAAPVEVATELQPVEAPVAEPVAAPASAAAPLGRFANALRLTGQACAAWADLIEGEAPDALTSRLADEHAVR